MDVVANPDIVPPWGYEYLPDQKAVLGNWKFQLFMSMVFGGYIWDVLISLLIDLQFIFWRRFNYVTVIFIVNRVSCIITLTNFWLIAVYTGDQCLLIYKLGGISEAITMFTSQALLMIRVWVLYQKNFYVLTFMVLLMFSGPVFTLTEAIITYAFNLPGNVGCMFGPSSPYIYLIFLLQALFDCLCFILCTYKLYKIGREQGGPKSIRTEMLNGGLAYYIPTVIIQIATVILTLQKGSDVQFILPPAADAISSAQALRITRNLWRRGKQQKQVYSLSGP